MSFTYGGISTNDLQGVRVTPLAYPNLGGLTLDTVETPGRDGRFYGGSRMTTSVISFRVTVSGENQMQADQRRLDLLRMLDPSTGARSLRLDNTANWHYPEAVVSEQIEWEKHIDRSKVIYDGTITFETNFDPAMRQIDPSTVSGSGRIEFIADMGSTVSYPTIIFESGGDLRVRVNDFTVDLYDTPPDIYGVLNWDEFKFYTAEADVTQSILYEWEGSPNASPSRKIAGAELVARNLTYGEPNTDSRIEYDSGFDSSELNLLTFTGGSSGYIGYSLGMHRVTPGEYFAHAVSFEWASGDIGRVRHQTQFRAEDNTSISAPQVQADKSGFPSGGRIAQVNKVPEGAWEARVYSWFYLEGGFDAPSEGSKISAGRYSAATADTEQDALAQVEEYFDGDSVGHVVPGERVSSLVNSMSHFERPAIYPGQRVEVEVTPIGSNTATPVIIYPNHRRL